MLKEFVLMNNNPAPQVTDDLTRIKGLGGTSEGRLHQAGILTFAQLAALTPLEIAALVSDVAGMSAEHIAEQDWPGQARKLAPRLDPVETHHDPPDATNPGNRQHDASFTVKLLLNEDNSVRRTQMVDNRSKAEEQWVGWNASRMMAFICQQADLQLPAAEPEPPVAAEPELEPAMASIDEVVPLATPAGAQPPTAAPADLGGTLHLLELEVLPADTNCPRRVFRHGLPFSVRLSIDLTEAMFPNNGPLSYTATIYAKSLGGGPRQAIGEARNTTIPYDQLTVVVPCRPLSEGSYRLEAVVAVSRPSVEPGIKAHLEGGILQVY
jgi:hypothetical protein